MGREKLFYQKSSKPLGLAYLEKDGAEMDSTYTDQTVGMCKLLLEYNKVCLSLECRVVQ